MPQSKKRKQQQHAHIDYIPHKKKRRSAVPVAIVFCAVLALGIAWFATGLYMPGLVIGTILGAVVGYFVGLQMDKTFDVKK